MNYRTLKLIIAIGALQIVAGCAVAPNPAKPNPHESTARTDEAIADDFDRMGKKDTAKTYRKRANEERLSDFEGNCSAASTLFGLLLKKQVSSKGC